MVTIPSEVDLAVAFAGLVCETIRGGDFAELLELNEAEANANVCHTHDFCDANELMLAAWLQLEPHASLDEIMHNTAAAIVWNDAWQMAKDDKFDIPTIRNTNS